MWSEHTQNRWFANRFEVVRELVREGGSRLKEIRRSNHLTRPSLRRTTYAIEVTGRRHRDARNAVGAFVATDLETATAAMLIAQVAGATTTGESAERGLSLAPLGVDLRDVSRLSEPACSRENERSSARAERSAEQSSESRRIESPANAAAALAVGAIARSKLTSRRQNARIGGEAQRGAASARTRPDPDHARKKGHRMTAPKFATIPGFEAADGAALVAELRRQITRRVRRVDHLPLFAAWVAPERVEVISRADAVARLKLAGLEGEARALSRMKPPPGHIPTWFESESGDFVGLTAWEVKA